MKNKISPLKNPNKFSLIDIFEELKYGRPKDGQEYLDKCIKELHNDTSDDIHKIISENEDGFFDKEDVKEVEKYFEKWKKEQKKKDIIYVKGYEDLYVFQEYYHKKLQNDDEYTSIMNDCNEFLNNKHKKFKKLTFEDVFPEEFKLSFTLKELQNLGKIIKRGCDEYNEKLDILTKENNKLKQK